MVPVPLVSMGLFVSALVPRRSLTVRNHDVVLLQMNECPGPLVGVEEAVAVGSLHIGAVVVYFVLIVANFDLALSRYSRVTARSVIFYHLFVCLQALHHFRM